MAIFFALLSYIGWAFGDIASVYSSRRVGAFTSTLMMYVIGLVVFSFYIPFVIHEAAGYTLPLFVLNIVLGIMYMIGNVSLNQSFILSNASLSGTISASFSWITVLLSVVFFGEQLTVMQAASIAVIFVGVILCTLKFSDLGGKKIFADKGLLPAVVSMVSFGVAFAFIRPVTDAVGWFWPIYIGFWTFPVLFFAKRFEKSVPTRGNLLQALPFAIGAAVLYCGGDFAVNRGIELGFTSVVTPIASSYPTLFVIVSFLLFKERLTKQQITGVIMALIGIVSLSFNS